MVLDFYKKDKDKKYNLEILTYLYEIHPNHLSRSSYNKNSFVEAANYNFLHSYLTTYYSIFETSQNAVFFSEYKEDKIKGTDRYALVKKFNERQSKVQKGQARSETSDINEYLKIYKSLDQYNLDFEDLIKNQNFDSPYLPQMKEKKHFYLYKRINLPDFKIKNYIHTAYVKKFTSEDYEKLPDFIENVEDLPHPKHHREYLAYHLRYLSKSQGQENIWDDSMIKDYLEGRKLNDENYEKHISKVNNAEKEFLLKQSMDLARYGKLLSEYKSNNHQSLINYVKFINSLSPYPKSLKPKKIEYEYNSDDKILLISLSLPDFERVSYAQAKQKRNGLFKTF